jgi:hypothetical protein
MTILIQEGDRVLTLRDFVLDEIAERLRRGGRDVQILAERPGPRLAVDNNVTRLEPKE